jgi:cytochrome c biogenesis protein CcmG/thiol:disulfide interchange protein DsbE
MNTMNKRFTLATCVLLFVFATAIFSSSLAAQQDVAQAVIPFSQPDPPAPQFALKNLAGNTVHLSDFRGKPVVLNFWATWCASCIVEMPTLMNLQRKYSSKGIAVIGISMDEDTPAKRIAAVTQKLGVQYTILRGDKEVAQLYGNVTHVPITFFISRDGLLIDRTFGDTTPEETELYIKKLIDLPVLKPTP